MPKTPKPTFSVWIGAAACKLDDDGDGGIRLFQCQYWEQPTEDRVKEDLFARLVPDWKQQYPGYTLHAACYEWEGTLYAAIEVQITEVKASLNVVVC